MRKIKIEKIVLNIGCGTTTSMDHAKKILQLVSNRKPIVVKSRKRSTFNVPKGKEIGCCVTLRKNTEEFLKKLLKVRDNTIKASSFDNQGNFAFGISEYIDVPGMEYDPKTGILGFDVCVTLVRPGYRVKKKKIKSKLGKKHVITKEEAREFAEKHLGIKIEEKTTIHEE